MGTQWGQCCRTPQSLITARSPAFSHQHHCSRGLSPNLPPSPRCLMVRDTWKLSSLLLLVTAATEALRSRYCVSLVKQRLCREQKAQEPLRSHRRHHGGQQDPSADQSLFPKHPGTDPAQGMELGGSQTGLRLGRTGREVSRAWGQLCTPSMG